MPADPALIAETRSWLSKADKDLAAPLTEYAWKFRYPGEPELPKVEEAAEALELAAEVRKVLGERLPPELG